MNIKNRPVVGATTRIALTTSAALTVAMTAMADIAVKDGEKIAFLGDSITQAGARPNGYVRLAIRALNQLA